MSVLLPECGCGWLGGAWYLQLLVEVAAAHSKLCLSRERSPSRRQLSQLVLRFLRELRQVFGERDKYWHGSLEGRPVFQLELHDVPFPAKMLGV